MMIPVDVLHLLFNVELIRWSVTWEPITMAARWQVHVLTMMIPVDVLNLMLNVELIRWSVTMDIMLMAARWEVTV